MEFCKSFFSRSEWLTYSVLKYDNFKFVGVQGWTPLKILIFLHSSWDLLSLRFSVNAVLFHFEWLCQKTAGNVNRPPYFYITVIHWAWPASSGRSIEISGGCRDQVAIYLHKEGLSCGNVGQPPFLLPGFTPLFYPILLAVRCSILLFPIIHCCWSPCISCGDPSSIPSLVSWNWSFAFYVVSVRNFFLCASFAWTYHTYGNGKVG